MSNVSGLDLALFLGGIWAAGKSMLDASAFVNDLRDSVVVGEKDGQALSLRHRRVLRIDWLLTMIGTVSFPIVYSTLLYVIASRLKPVLDNLYSVLLVVCAVPLIGSVLFIVCGVLDWRLMCAAIDDASESRIVVPSQHAQVSANASEASHNTIGQVS